MVKHDAVGSRLSFASHLCTVRYLGPIDNKDGLWLGVEWDDSSRGKNDGRLGGRRYFTSAQAARHAQDHSHKYSCDESVYREGQSRDATQTVGLRDLGRPIEFGSKVAEEVGFDKIRTEQSKLSQIRVAILDGQCIEGTQHLEEEEKQAYLYQLALTFKSVTELDISRNLLEHFEDACDVLAALPNLRQLRLNGNRFIKLKTPSADDQYRRRAEAGACITSLSLDDTLIPWQDLFTVLRPFKNLETLSFSSNQLKRISLSGVHFPRTLTSLKLASNAFVSIRQLVPLAEVAPNLRSLDLRFNNISEVVGGSDMSTPFPTALSSLNLGHNLIARWEEIAAIPATFPGVQNLCISHNPLYEITPDRSGDSVDGDDLDETSRYLLSVAHIPGLTTLNYTTITVADRLNADLYYMSHARSKLAKLRTSLTDEAFEKCQGGVLLEFPRWVELCRKYGESTTVAVQEIKSETWLESRLISFTFALEEAEGKISRFKSIKIPGSVDVYRLKSVVWKIFGIPTHLVRLVWETDIWDPLAPDEMADEDEEEDDGKVVDGTDKKLSSDRSKGVDKQHDPRKWRRREVELEDSPREVSFWIDSKDARIRVVRR